MTTTTTTTSLDSQIASLAPGSSLRLPGGHSECWTTAERSGDGRTVRFVRHTPSSDYVFRVARS